MCSALAAICTDGKGSAGVRTGAWKQTGGDTTDLLRYVFEFCRRRLLHMYLGVGKHEVIGRDCREQASCARALPRGSLGAAALPSESGGARWSTSGRQGRGRPGGRRDRDLGRGQSARVDGGPLVDHCLDGRHSGWVLGGRPLSGPSGSAYCWTGGPRPVVRRTSILSVIPTSIAQA